MDITQRSADKWIVDFAEFSEVDASLFETPFAHVLANVKPERMLVARERRRRFWWQFNETAPGMRAALHKLERFIATPETPTYTLFSWQPAGVIPDKNLVVIARADDVTFGILTSRFHIAWVRALGSPYGNHPTARRYNSSRVFETFPFPSGLTPRDTVPVIPAEAGIRSAQPWTPACAGVTAEVIAAAARRLDELREAWLNPAEWVDWVITPEEEKAGFPKRPVAKPGHEADLKKRTLTNLYNARPAWLDLAQKQLDQAVAAAYGWPDYSPEMPDDEILRRLLALNLERAAR